MASIYIGYLRHGCIIDGLFTCRPMQRNARITLCNAFTRDKRISISIVKQIQDNVIEDYTTEMILRWKVNLVKYIEFVLPRWLMNSCDASVNTSTCVDMVGHYSLGERHRSISRATFLWKGTYHQSACQLKIFGVKNVIRKSQGLTRSKRKYSVRLKIIVIVTDNNLAANLATVYVCMYVNISQS